MGEEFSPLLPVVRLLGSSGFGDAVGCVKDAAIDDIQEITSLGSYLMWNDAAVYGGRVRLKYFMRFWLDIWKSLKRDSTMIFSVTLICCEYRDVSLLTRVQPSQQDTSLCDSTFTG